MGSVVCLCAVWYVLGSSGVWVRVGGWVTRVVCCVCVGGVVCGRGVVVVGVSVYGVGG